jgi:hypothetical protein
MIPASVRAHPLTRLPGACGLFTGAVAGIIRSAPTAFFSVIAGGQWFTLATSYYGEKHCILIWCRCSILTGYSNPVGWIEALWGRGGYSRRQSEGEHRGRRCCWNAWRPFA